MRKGMLPIVLWGIVILINAYFIYTFVFRHFNLDSWNRPFGPLLSLHIVFGMIALLVGPLQFFASVRKNHLQFHRLSGKLYLFAVLAGATCAILLSIQHNMIAQKRFAFGTGTLGLAAAWLLTSAMALWAIKNRNLAQHREWMIRSYVVTCGFTVYRILFLLTTPYLSSANADYKNEVSGILAWSCWSIPLLLTEAFLQVGKIKRQSIVSKSAINTVVAKSRIALTNPSETTTQQPE